MGPMLLDRQRSQSTFVDLLQCPATGQRVEQDGDSLVTLDGRERFAITASGIPVMAEQFCSAEGRVQQLHYDAVAAAYLKNLGYPHTQEYMSYLDRMLLDTAEGAELGTVAELCCGRGEAFRLFGDRIGRGVGVDVSLQMLEAARADLCPRQFSFVQGDATSLPLQSEAFDSVFMLGGIHHVNDRRALFSEVFRVLRPGGRFIWREPVNDMLLWRALRRVVYRLSPGLDHKTERPLRWHETWPVLEQVGLTPRCWQTFGFLGFCLFMNSDILVANRALRFVPGIRAMTRAVTRLDAWTASWPGMARRGLQVVGYAEKAA